MVGVSSLLLFFFFFFLAKSAHSKPARPAPPMQVNVTTDSAFEGERGEGGKVMISDGEGGVFYGVERGNASTPLTRPSEYERKRKQLLGGLVACDLRAAFQ
eukprot:TRINITY_DN12399_c0_g1_i1.p1 TRINITY_DN12399_c0_g1~~TRINITY_DN12399_c0_g1_i1.p1  ORF type:complete len:101 (-),score=6.39 TRINITY_DN12399_c0_g1_i1:12-314(-)